MVEKFIDAALDERVALGGEFDDDAAAVGRRRPPPHQPIDLRAGDALRDRCRTDQGLAGQLPGSELVGRSRAAKRAEQIPLSRAG